MTPQLPVARLRPLAGQPDEVGSPAALRRDLRLFYLFRLLATSYLYIPIFILFQADRGLTHGDRLTLAAIYSAVIVLVEVPTGVLADRFGRRRSMLLGAIAMVASCVIAIQAHAFSTFVIAEALGALSIALCSGADSAYLYDLLASHDRGHEYPRRESAASAWHLVGSAIAFAGGGRLAAIDLSLPYLVTAAVAAIAAVVACLLREDPPTRHHARIPAIEALAVWARGTVDALAAVARRQRLAWLVGYSAVVFVLLRVTVYVYQPYLAERGLDTIEIGDLFAAGYVVGALAAFRTYRLRAWAGDERLLWTLIGVLAVSFVGLASAARGPWMLGLLLVQALANGVYSPLTKPLLNREIEDSSQRAAILSVESMGRRAVMGGFALFVALHGETDQMMLCGIVGLGGLVILAIARVVVPATPPAPSP
ncbi:MAG TPA: MFS transporter [Kofleriaceae bacterium]|nr:MFS transporter [Kofleriaceae bacterium]